jgi:hypothetical protein
MGAVAIDGAGHRIDTVARKLVHIGRCYRVRAMNVKHGACAIREATHVFRPEPIGWHASRW